jgi:hypothetical protein
MTTLKEEFEKLFPEKYNGDVKQNARFTPKVSRFTELSSFTEFSKWKNTSTQFNKEPLHSYKTEDSLTETWKKILVREVDGSALIQRLVSSRLKPENFLNQGYGGSLFKEFPEVLYPLVNSEFTEEQLAQIQEENIWIESASWIKNKK